MSSFLSTTRKTTIFYVALIAMASLVVGMVIASRLDHPLPSRYAQADAAQGQHDV